MLLQQIYKKYVPRPKNPSNGCSIGSQMIEAHIVEIKSSKTDSASLKNQEKIFIWTSSIDYRSNFYAARKHTVGVPGTGRWFIDGIDFRQWRTMGPSEGASNGRAILLQGLHECQ